MFNDKLSFSISMVLFVVLTHKKNNNHNFDTIRRIATHVAFTKFIATKTKVGLKFVVLNYNLILY